MRKPFLVCWKRHTPWFTKFEFENFFSLFYIISTQIYYIHQKLDTNGCYAKLRANSYLFSFFLHTLYIHELVIRDRQLASVAQLVRALHRNRRATGSIPARDLYWLHFHSTFQCTKPLNYNGDMPSSRPLITD